MLAKMIIEPISRHAEAFSKASFDTFAPFCLGLFASFMVLWFSIFIYQAVVLSKLEWEAFLKKIILLTIMVAALGPQKNLYWEYIHEPIKLASEILVTKIVTLAPKATKEAIRNPAGLIDTVENTITEVTTLLYNVSEKAGYLSLHAGLLSAIIWILFVVSEAIFALYLLGNTLKLAALSALSPFLFLAFIFDKTRVHTIAGIKYVLTSLLLLMIAAFCMGLFLFALREVVTSIGPGDVPKSEVFSVLGMMLVLALVSIYFLLIAPEMASVILGSQSGSVLPGIIAGAMAAGTGYIATKTGGLVGSSLKGSAGKAAKWTNETTRSVGSNLISNIRERFDKNYASSSSPKLEEN